MKYSRTDVGFMFQLHGLPGLSLDPKTKGRPPRGTQEQTKNLSDIPLWGRFIRFRVLGLGFRSGESFRHSVLGPAPRRFPRTRMETKRGAMRKTVRISKNEDDMKRAAEEKKR